ncbi:aspartate/glutamate racemase family protein [Streptomyces blastmyceticus]|uniref:Hydantoin racemase n=1 Tax=Streptomyces blastmyceticus TaxID=68180 RepID=A0ABP3G7K3_9ACTN
MRIWLQKHTVQGRLPLLDTWYREHMDAVASPGTVVDIKTLPDDAYGDRTPVDLVQYSALAVMFDDYFGRTAVAAERRGYDAWVIAAGQDPGLVAARTRAAIPVLGYGETAFHLAAMFGYRFAVVGFNSGLEEPIRENIQRYGLTGRLAAYEIVGAGSELVHKAMSGDCGPFAESFADAALRAARKGAQIIIPGEGFPNEVLWHLGIHELHGLPVVDPAGLLVRMAETAVHAGQLGILSRPTTGHRFRRPDAGVVDHLQEVLLNAMNGKDGITS